MDYRESVEWIVGLPRFPLTPSPARVQRYLERLDHPERRFVPVNVAGTNGKGSTAAVLESVLGALGKRVGLYTSPHLSRVNERMRVAGVDIPDDAFARLATTLKALVDEEVARDPAAAPAGFDALTAIAFAWFAEEGVDVAVVEAGIGGRLDATNAFDAAPVVIVTNVDVEHADVLGPTRAAIAREKSALAKAGSVLVTAEADAEPLDVLRAHAAAVGARLMRVGEDVRVRLIDSTLEGTRFDYAGARERIADVRVPLAGGHQATNAACALAAVEALAARGLVEWGADEVRAGLARARWPGRLEIIARDPLVVTDAAHNPHGVRALVDALPALLGNRPRVLVLGVSGTKPYREMIPPLLTLADDVVVTRAAYHGLETARVVDEVLAAGRDAARVTVRERVADALAFARARVPADGVVLVLGGLFLAAEARDVLTAPALVRPHNS